MIRTMLSVICILSILAIVAFILYIAWKNVDFSNPIANTIADKGNTPVLIAYQNRNPISYISFSESGKRYHVGRSKSNDLKIPHMYIHNHRFEFEIWKYGSIYRFRTPHSNLQLLDENMRRIHPNSIYVLNPDAEIHSGNIIYVIGTKDDLNRKNSFWEIPTKAKKKKETRR